ncbi:hypothetical protein Q7A53_10030 [Halobacillus rhizosphaerae]|uniref:hypothetical protein n=1 Tax=Halobacillus rhizosphaerae TaxID=3064889 RepID=UPI00398B4B88
MSWVSGVFLGVLLLMIVLIGSLLASLAKQGDERKNFIKRKTMADSFVLVVGMLMIDILQSFYQIYIKGGEPVHLNPFMLLVWISVIFLIAMLVNKKRFGN